MSKVNKIFVTAGGFGSVWLHPDPDNHPLFQYGDAILECAEDVCSQYVPREIGFLLEALDDEILSDRVSRLDAPTPETTPRQMQKYLEDISVHVWEAMERKARPVPVDDTEVTRLIVEDREKLATRRSKMADAKTTGGDAAKKEPKEKKSRSAFGDDDIIKMGVDKDGNPYGPKNNPKREGSKSHPRFACYRDGMKVKQFRDAVLKVDEKGPWAADLKYDAAKGFIVIEPAKAA